MKKSHPSRGGWIEIGKVKLNRPRLVNSPTPHGVGGLKLLHWLSSSLFGGSHPSRGGWIEITWSKLSSAITPRVPPLTGWVD